MLFQQADRHLLPRELVGGEGNSREPKKNYLHSIGRVAGWRKTLQRNVIVYCNMCLTRELEKYSI